LKIIAVVSKTAHILAQLYSLYQVYSEDRTPLHHPYYGEISEQLYYGYLLEREGLWEEAFKAVIGLNHSKKVNGVLKKIAKTKVYGWRSISLFLRRSGRSLVQVYESKKKDIKALLTSVLGVRRFYSKVYAILAFSPLRRLVGNPPVYSKDEEYTIVPLFIGLESTPEKVLDLLVHELLHGLIKLNDLGVSEEEEEEFIDMLCPEGYLSRELGLAEKPRILESGFSAIVERYFSEKKYYELTLIDYIKLYRSNQYLL